MIQKLDSFFFFLTTKAIIYTALPSYLDVTGRPWLHEPQMNHHIQNLVLSAKLKNAFSRYLQATKFSNNLEKHLFLSITNSGDVSGLVKYQGL